MVKFFKKIIKSISDYFDKLENDPEFLAAVRYQIEQQNKNWWNKRF